MATFRNLNLAGIATSIGLAVACTNGVEPPSVNAAADPKPFFDGLYERNAGLSSTEG